MTTSRPDDSWHEGDPYERYVGRWSRFVAIEFLEWLDMPPSQRWLDVGCGTGALMEAISRQCQPVELIGVEPSDGFLAKARDRLSGKAAFHVGNGSAIPLPDSSVDVVVSGLVLNFIPDVASAMKEMKRVASTDGMIAAYVWDYAGKMELMRHFWDSAVELNADARPLHEGVRFPLCHPDALDDIFHGAGLTQIEIEPIDIETRFANFDDYWSPFLGGQGPAPAYAMSLDETSRNRLRDRLRDRLPAQSDGSIALTARAWAIKGGVPGR